MPRPEHAYAIRLFDYAAAVCFGAASASGAAWVVPQALPMPLAMVLGMGVGGACVLPLLGVFSSLLAGLELAVIGVQVGMIAGMVGATLGGGASAVASCGAGVGLLVQLALHAADHSLHGEVTLR